MVYRDGQHPVDLQQLEAMASALAHRGPDAQGAWTGSGVGLAHRRLSIIDLSEQANQPMPSADGRSYIVYNGEIYNYRQLRGDLQHEGAAFRTNSDTEVLLAAVRRWKRQAVTHLRGMFAFAVWDDREQAILLGRDRVGLKPLYYLLDDEKFVFASEIKALLLCSMFARAVEPTAVADYFTYGCIPSAKTIYRDIYKLPPGHTLTLSRATWSPDIRRYWQWQAAGEGAAQPGVWEERIRAKVAESVEAHRVADVPVGAFLSGGIDSSVIVAGAARHDRLRSFSVGFDESEFSELPFARRVAEQFSTEHTERVLAPDAEELFGRLVRHYDEPFADSSALPTMLLSQVASEQVKVVLSGDGGDEAFGGYRRYAHDLLEFALRRRIPKVLRDAALAPLAQLWPKADRLPRLLRWKTALENLASDPAAAYANTLSICRPALRASLFSPELKQALRDYRPEQIAIDHYRTAPPDDPLSAMLTTDINLLLPDDFLVKVDRASMSFGLEVRPPLVDHELLEMAAAIPSSLKVRRGKTKWILKQSYAELLPGDLLYRKKQGFEIPVDLWLRGPLQPLFQAMVLESGRELSAWLDLNEVQRLYTAHARGAGRHGAVLWAVLVFAAWYARYGP